MNVFHMIGLLVVFLVAAFCVLDSHFNFALSNKIEEIIANFRRKR